MMLIKRNIQIVVLIGWLASPAWGAVTRTIQFSGSTLAKPTHDLTNNLATVSDCRVLIANTGTSQQTINSVQFSYYNSSTGLAVMGGVAMDSLRVDTTAPITDCVSTNTIQPGGFCMFRALLQNVQYDGNLAICSGQISVTDSTNTPGSVVASGALQIIQEAQVMGGMLSGAYYASGAHIDPPAAGTTSIQAAPAMGGWAIPDGVHGEPYHDFNMNMFCSTACGASGIGGTSYFGSDAFCDENCGTDGDFTQTSGLNQPWPWSGQDYGGGLDQSGASGEAGASSKGFYRAIQGYFVPMSPALSWQYGASASNGTSGFEEWLSPWYYFQDATPPYNTGQKVTFPNLTVNPPSCTAPCGLGTVSCTPAPFTFTPSYGGTPINFGFFPPADYVSCGTANIPRWQLITLNTDTSTGTPPYPPGTPPSMSMRTSNFHYAGGMVYEMIVGPLISVCSGNTAFWSEGGQEFSHPDGVDADALVGDATNNSYPPERLLCFHRHGMDDLFFSLGSEASFAINGGNPF
jgi:hypothetical protein